LKSTLKPGFRSSLCLTSSGTGSNARLDTKTYTIRAQPPETSDFLQEEVPLGQQDGARACASIAVVWMSRQKRALRKLLLLFWECRSLGLVNQARPPLISDVT